MRTRPVTVSDKSRAIDVDPLIGSRACFLMSCCKPILDGPCFPDICAGTRQVTGD